MFPLRNVAIIGKIEVARGFWNQVNWKNDNPLLFVTAEQNRPIMIISQHRILWTKQSSKTSCSNVKRRCKHILKRHHACYGHQPLRNFAKIIEDHPRLFWTFTNMLHPLKILIIKVHLIPLIYYWYFLVKIICFPIFNGKSITLNTLQ